jgi:4-amino-4-deoxy-L-arabinose transferase-like glycosyltransferase
MPDGHLNSHAKSSSWSMLLRVRVHHRWLILGLVLLTILARLPALGSRSLWYDEAFSILFARQGPSAMIYGTLTPTEGVAAEEHPLLYYSILWVWMKLFGQGILAVRSLSLGLSVALLLALILLARELFNPPIALLTGLLFALSPFQIHYGQEARMYVLLALCLVLATFTLLRGISRQSMRFILLFGLFSALALYSHVLAIFFLVSLAAILFAQSPTRATGCRLIQGSMIGLLIYLPWLIQLPGQISKVQQSYWIERPGVSALMQTLIGFVVDLPISGRLLPVMLVISLIIFTFVWMESIRLLRGHTRDEKAGALVLGLTWLPVLLLFVVSQIRPLYILRGLFASGGMYLLAIAWILFEGRKLSSWTLGLCLLLGFLAGNITHFNYAGFPYAPYTELNDYLRANQKPGAIVLHANKLTMLPAYLDDPALPHLFLRDPPGSGSDTLAYPTQEILGIYAELDPLKASQGASNVYFIVFQQELDDYAQLGFTRHPALTALGEQFRQSNLMEWGDLLLYTLEPQG